LFSLGYNLLQCRAFWDGECCNNYLRKILIHGARAVVLRSKRDRIAMGAWMTSLEMRAPRNVSLSPKGATGGNAYRAWVV
jgi:hypothetical protein